MARPGAILIGLSLLAFQPQDGLPDGVEGLKDIEFGKGGDVSLKLDLYRPAKRSGKLPGVVFIHGGGWQEGSRLPAFGMPELAARGYVTVSIDYRLSTPTLPSFPAAVEDSKCAVRWFRANADKYGVDPNRIGVYGLSAGAHLALLVGCARGMEGKGGFDGVSSKVQAVVSLSGPTNFMEKFPPATMAVVERFIGGTRESRPQEFKQASPVTHVTKDDPPVLLAQGDKDELVPFEQAKLMEKALKDVGVPVELLLVKNADHVFGGKDAELNVAQVFDRSYKFLDAHLKPRKP